MLTTRIRDAVGTARPRKTVRPDRVRRRASNERPAGSISASISSSTVVVRAGTTSRGVVSSRRPATSEKASTPRRAGASGVGSGRAPADRRSCSASSAASALLPGEAGFEPPPLFHPRDPLGLQLLAEVALFSASPQRQRSGGHEPRGQCLRQHGKAPRLAELRKQPSAGRRREWPHGPAVPRPVPPPFCPSRAPQVRVHAPLVTRRKLAGRVVVEQVVLGAEHLLEHLRIFEEPRLYPVMLLGGSSCRRKGHQSRVSGPPPPAPAEFPHLAPHLGMAAPADPLQAFKRDPPQALLRHRP